MTTGRALNQLDLGGGEEEYAGLAPDAGLAFISIRKSQRGACSSTCKPCEQARFTTSRISPVTCVQKHHAMAFSAYVSLQQKHQRQQQNRVVQ